MLKQQQDRAEHSHEEFDHIYNPWVVAGGKCEGRWQSPNTL
jgi:hypothetical protein